MKLELGNLQVDRFERSVDGEVFLGTVQILGTAMHFQAIRVKDDEPWVAVNDPQDHLSDVFRVYDAALLPTEIPGLEGLYIVCIFPHAEPKG